MRHILAKVLDMPARQLAIKFVAEDRPKKQQRKFWFGFSLLLLIYTKYFQQKPAVLNPWQYSGKNPAGDYFHSNNSEANTDARCTLVSILPGILLEGVFIYIIQRVWVAQHKPDAANPATLKLVRLV
ncbi:hypothetical protein FVR03_08305 [Pontibacter qinzhouensis]|uniref:Uncharacterized protein n=1 Tax=Pontibacter qinzhouensis TaxID=2603253 RepID=A0A5C8KA85_9BACT|nr:hypothetical protein [Pontibacter qinzhouensis]TXK48160.1 hypothetical protein FVR03_08305 [Pontibacter qinzhouensis]